ncbi:hypothetical protein, partial [Weissella confusa]|uniref:hypothetical protein n=1 Tax=Weissella confusa TaxID=1583 RepID=UPI001C0F3AF5
GSATKQRQTRFHSFFVAPNITSLIAGTPLLKIFQNQTFLQENGNVCALLLRHMGAGSLNF